MSILDTFTVVFDSNSDEVEAGAEKATEAGKRLQAELDGVGESGASAFDQVKAHAAAGQAAQAEVVEGSKAVSHSLHEAGEEGERAFDKIKEHAKEMTEQLIEHAFEVAAAFKAMFEVEKLIDNFFEQAERSDQLGEKAKSMGVAVEELDAWGQAVRRVGGTAEGFEQSLRTVNVNLERIAITGHSRMLPFLQQLHIGLKNTDGSLKTSFQLLDELPKKIDGMDKAKSGALLRGIGLDEGTIRLMQAGSKETEELVERAKELGVVTKEDAEIAEKFNREWMDVKQLFNSFVLTADSFLLPTLEAILRLVEEFVSFLREHKDFVIGFFLAIGFAITAVVGPFALLGKAFYGLGAIIGLLTTPLGLVITAILAIGIAFAFVYDDIVNFMEGNNSIIGELSKRWPIVGEVVKDLVGVFKGLWNNIKEGAAEIYAWIKRIPEGFMQWEDGLFSMGKRFAAFFSGLPTAAQAAFAELNQIVEGAFAIIKAVTIGGVEGINVAVNALYEMFKTIFMLIANLIVNPKEAFKIFVESVKAANAELIAAFPALISAFDSVGKAFADIGNGIMKLWERIGSLIGGTIGKIGGAIKGLGSYFHAPTMFSHDDKPARPGALSSVDPAGAAAADDGAQAAREHMAAANTPLLSQTPTGAAAGVQNIESHKTVEINAPTTINTQSTDPAAIKSEFDRSLGNHLDSAINHFADGVSH